MCEGEFNVIDIEVSGQTNGRKSAWPRLISFNIERIKGIAVK